VAALLVVPAIGVDLPVRFGAGLDERLEEPMPRSSWKMGSRRSPHLSPTSVDG